MDTGSFVLLFCSVFALSSACCTPDKWEGGEGVFGAYAEQKKHGLIKEHIRVAYDGVNNRTAAFVELRGGEHSTKLRVIVRYDNDDGEGKLYVVDLKRDKCWVKSLKHSFRRACIPDDAKSVGDFYVGLYGGFKATAYEVRARDLEATVSVEKLDNNQCLPIGESLHGRRNKVDFVQHVGFFDITLGIKNETVFDVPRQCQQKDDFSFAQELTRDHFIMAI